MFRIIGLELLQPTGRCKVDENTLKDLPLDQRMSVEHPLAEYQSIHKGLKVDNPYVFYHNYTIRNGKVDYRPDDVIDTLYGDKVSVCAIVGENGSGKSTLMELVIRMMNNVAFALRRGLWPDDREKENLVKYTQHFVPCVFARLYIHTDNGIITITQNDFIISVNKQGSKNEDGFNWSHLYGGIFDFGNKNRKESQKLLSDLFYSIVVNYASYAYNIYDYRAEWTEPIEKIAPQNQQDDEWFTMDNWTDEERCWIGTLFHKNDGYQLPIVLNPFRERGNINYNNEKNLLNERLTDLVRSVDADTMEYILQGKRPDCFVFDINREYSEPNHGFCNSQRVFEAFDNAAHFERDINMINNYIKDASKHIVDAWGKVTGVDLYDEALMVDRGDFRRAHNYLVYKTVKIASTYDDFKKYRTCWKDDVKLLEYVKILHETNNHITKKLRRALAFILFGHYHTSLGNGDKSHIVSVGQFKDTVHRLAGTEKGGIVWTESDLMPAQCFHTELWFKLSDGKLIQYSQFSSGEKQMINLVCTIVYHLQNLHSNIGSKTKVGYPYVNLMIDEIELYFHPRYQTMLIKFLLESIKRLKLDGFKGMNIMIATHSPYLLSDIPKSNIIRLENGAAKPDKDIPESFGANVYDLLNHHFFMNQFIGDYAADKIDSIVRGVVGYDKCSTAEKKALRKSISLIGDDFIRNTLIQKIESYDKDRV